MNRLGFILVFFLFNWFQLFAQEDKFVLSQNQAELKSKILLAHEKVNSIRSKFTQEKELSFMQEKVVSKGRFSMRRDRKMRIDYFTPFAYLVVFDGDKIKVKDGKKVIKIDAKSDKSFSQLNEILAQSLKGELDGLKGFDIRYFESKSGVLISLKPLEKGLKELYSNIKILLDHKSYQVVNVELNEVSGDKTKMIFEDSRINEPISDKEFEVH